MNGSDSEKAVIDTNVIFMALYNPESKAGRLIQLTLEGKIKLFSTDSVKEELLRVFKREIKLEDNEIEQIISALPVSWISKDIYGDQLKNTKIKHKADKPIEALAITLNCNILSADKHFKKRLDINKLLERLE